MLRDDLHVHLYGCLSAEDLFELGRDLWRNRTPRLEWYAKEFERATGRLPQWNSYWTRESGFDLLKADYTCKKNVSFDVFQASFNLSIALFPVIPGETVVLDHVLQKQREEGVRYAEYRTFIPPHLPDDHVREYVRSMTLKTLEYSRSSADESNLDPENSFSPRLVLSLMRDPVICTRHYRIIKSMMQDPVFSRMVVGIDLSGVEEGHPPSIMQDFLAEVRRDNQQTPEHALAVLYHVGESFDDKTLASAVRWVVEAHAFGAHRLGHALALGLLPQNVTSDRQQSLMQETVAERIRHLEWLLANAGILQDCGHRIDLVDTQQNLASCLNMNPHATLEISMTQDYLDDTLSLQNALLKQLAATDVVIESCPTSNLMIGRMSGKSHHPIQRFMNAGLRVTVGTDDPGMFETSLAGEERILKAWGFRETDLQALEAHGRAARSVNLARRPD